MDDDQVIELARDEGFELIERLCGDRSAWGFVRRDLGPVEGYRYPCGERRIVLNLMRDRLRRGSVFE